MVPQKIDGVLECVHYDASGQLETLRVYQRRGAAFSDRMLLSRADFIQQLKLGRKYVAGQRILYMGSSFETGVAIQLSGKTGAEVIVQGSDPAEKDSLPDVPVI